MKFLNTPFGKSASFGAGLTLTILILTAPAMAQSCQEDIAKLTARRQAQIVAINQSGKATKGKLDPVASCPRLRNLAAIENEFLGYMIKNKEWCHVPDEAIANVRAGHGKTAGIAAQACNIAKQVQRARQQQAAGGAGSGGGGGQGAVQQQPATKLPTGPL